MEITNTPIDQLISFLQSRKCSSRELTQAFLDRIDLENQSINAICWSDRELALQQAEKSDIRRSQGAPLSEWDGIPFALKDILCTRGIPTTCGSRYLENFVPPYDATAVNKLFLAGLVLVGKTNLDEFAMGGSTETSIFGATKNPRDLSRTAGGSSGGSAAAVAARMAPFAIGTDTGGSIRQPAAYCGVCGLKPTYGRVSRYGLIAYASSLDTVGVFAHSASELAKSYGLIAGHDRNDSTSVPSPVGSTDLLPLPKSLPLKIGVIREHLEHEGLHPEVRMAIQRVIQVFQEHGASIVEVSLPHSEFAVPAYYIIAPSEASSNLSRFDGAHYGRRAAVVPNPPSGSPLVDMYSRSRSEGFGAEVQRRIMLGTYTLSSGYYDAYYLKALQVRRLIRQDYDAAFKQVDILLGPTTPGPAFRLGEKLNDPVQMYLEDWYTVGANLAGIPAVSIPCGETSESLPIGVQFQAAPLEEQKVLQAAHWYELLTHGNNFDPSSIGPS